MDKLHALLTGIFELANNDVIVADHDSGVNNYDMQYGFATKLAMVAKKLVLLSNDCTQQASSICDKIAHYQDNKHVLQQVYYVQEIVKESQKVGRSSRPKP